MKQLIAVPMMTLLLTPSSPSAQPVAQSRLTNTVFELADGTRMTYGIAVPSGYEADPADPRPLVLALHPGGSAPYYGSGFMRGIVEPALRDWKAIILAPDVPAGRWNNETSEQAVLALVDDVMLRHAIDRNRILVTGFSMGGRGTWYLATRHGDLFTGAIPMAASRGEDSLDGLGAMPVHLIHSPDDEVVPYEPARETAEILRGRNHDVRLLSVEGVGHYDMTAYVDSLRAAGRWMWDRWEARGR